MNAQAEAEAVPIRTEATDPRCRLCGGELAHRFDLKVLEKYQVGYFRCRGCDSLQTEDPYWLSEAYSHNLSNLDTGAGQRNLQNLGVCYAISKIYKARSAIDIGGGSGLLCRFLRDYAINCFVSDKYAAPTYAQGFTEPDFDKPDMVMAFEVLEHFANPRVDLDPLFALDPKVLLISTGFYDDQKQDWWYLSAESGQHLFFYSKKALQFIAARYGYEMVRGGEYTLFVKPESFSASRKFLTRVFFKDRINRLSRSLIVLLPTPGVWQDHLLQLKRAKSDGPAP